LLVETTPADGADTVDAVTLLALIGLIDIHPFSVPSQWTRVRPGFDNKLKSFCVLAHPFALLAMSADMPPDKFMSVMRMRWKLVDPAVPLVE
jgi:hypothetical protein